MVIGMTERAFSLELTQCRIRRKSLTEEHFLALLGSGEGANLLVATAATMPRSTTSRRQPNSYFVALIF